MWLWDSVPLRRAFADLDLDAALTIIRTAPGLSQLEFATLLGWISRRLPVLRQVNGKVSMISADSSK